MGARPAAVRGAQRGATVAVVPRLVPCAAESQPRPQAQSPAPQQTSVALAVLGTATPTHKPRPGVQWPEHDGSCARATDATIRAAAATTSIIDRRAIVRCREENKKSVAGRLIHDSQPDLSLRQPVELSQDLSIWPLIRSICTYNSTSSHSTRGATAAAGLTQYRPPPPPPLPPPPRRLR